MPPRVDGMGGAVMYSSVEQAMQAGTTIPIIAMPDNTILVGPHVTAEGPCLSCLTQALKDAGHTLSLELGRPTQTPPWLTALLTELVRHLRNAEPGRVYLVTTTGQVSAAYLPAGTCGRCTPEHSSWSPDTRHSVQRSALPRLPLDTLTNASLGPFLNIAVHPDLSGPLTVVTAQLAAYRSGQRVYGVGRDERIERAKTVAALEALERYGGLSNRSGAPRQQASLTALGAHALDPRRMGLYAPAQYNRDGFPCRSFQAETERSWVQGYALTQAQSIWVEESLVYYDADQPDPLVLNNSNGCALGQTREEAVLYGLLELLERDGALRWWHAGCPMPQVALQLDSATDRQVIEVWTERGYILRAYDTTRWGIPTVVMVGIDPGGARRPFNIGCASASAFTTQDAVSKALAELSSVLGAQDQRSAADEARALELSEHPDRVQQLDDHLLACTGAAARDRFSPLLSSNSRWAEPYTVEAATLGDVLDLLAGQGLDVIAVDQSSPLHHELGLSCVRTLVPGLLGLSYGAGFERLDPLGLPRRIHSPHPFS